jgi:pyruvate,water dikinase
MFTIPFTSTEATLQVAGGKGANLARLTRAGFPVPRGFIVPTAAYRAFVDANDLTGVIAASLMNLAPGDAAQLEAASAAICMAFSRGRMPEGAAAAICAAYESMAGEDTGDLAVAVRSSATLEDLPDLSFAGQQDTFLNVIGAPALLRAVVDCWSSLWTGRAIGYRMRNGLDRASVALAVIVQEMAPSDVSGVLFTANPLTGLLSESVIDATFGLGEALVAGQVEPDHFVVDARSGEIRSMALGAKQVATRGRPGGGVETVTEGAGARQALAPEEVRELVRLGQRVQAEYGAPQDIEWALVRPDGDGRIGIRSPGYKLYLLQSRPITSLFPTPEVSFDPLLVWFSFGAVQGVTGPFTPLGRDVLRHLLAGMGALFGLTLKVEEVKVLASAGERLWVKISDLLRHPVGIHLVQRALTFIEPGTAQIVRVLAEDPRLGAGQGKVKISTIWRVLRVLAPVMGRVVRNWVRPTTARARLDADVEAYLAAGQLASGVDRFERLSHAIAFMRNRTAEAFSLLFPRVLSVLGPGMGALALLGKLAGEQSTLALEVTRALPNNVTTEMDLSLWQTAATIRADAESAEVFAATDATTLARDYLDGTLPPVAQTAVAHFMTRYGMRGPGEIDLGQPRWREDPMPVMHTLQSYLQIDPEAAPDVMFARGEAAAAAAIEALAADVRRQRLGWLKEKVARAAARRVRLFLGVRESPKFFIVRTMGIVRHALLDVGREFVEAGALDQPDDLVFLSLSELESLSRNEPGDWRAIIAGRRALYERETRRRQTPRVLVSDGRAFYEGLGALADAGDMIVGSPVSPGVVEGTVHVVLDPRGAQLAPGEILVCPGTDPAWTPLFLTAGGLITEVGGMMTHGSVVAREYGIPAVVGVHQATDRLKDGQRIRVDGTQGRIAVLGE